MNMCLTLRDTAGYLRKDDIHWNDKKNNNWTCSEPCTVYERISLGWRDITNIIMDDNNLGKDAVQSYAHVFRTNCSIRKFEQFCYQGNAHAWPLSMEFSSATPLPTKDLSQNQPYIDKGYGQWTICADIRLARTLPADNHIPGRVVQRISPTRGLVGLLHI